MHPIQVLNTDSRNARSANREVSVVTTGERCKSDKADNARERKNPSIAANRFGSKSIAFAFQ